MATPNSVTPTDGPPSKKRRLSNEEEPKTITAASLASIPRAKKVVTNGARPTPPPRDQRREPPPRARSPSPERSPPRERKRPRTTRPAIDQERRRQEQEAREAETRKELQAASAARGHAEAISQHYNAVEQRGKQWRKTDSKIKGLRSLNNWIKSAVIQKFSPSENRSEGGLLVLDIGCGKGGDLAKWHACPQPVDLYVGFDGADVSIEQAKGRYMDMRKQPQRGRQARKLYEAEFAVKDCFTNPVAEAQIVQNVGKRAGGFDVVTMMFCMHYAFETEQKAKNMIRNVAGSLKKGGRFIGTIPSSEIINAKLAEYHTKRGGQPVVQEEENEESDDEWDPEKPSEAKAAPSPSTTPPQTNGDVPEELEFGNEIYHVKIPKAASFPTDGIYRPPYGWRYTYFLEEAVEAPEWVVPWAAFRALASEYGLELRWEKAFNKIWDEERNDRILGPLSERMGVVDRDTGVSKVNDAEMEAASFYRAFCFYKT